MRFLTYNVHGWQAPDGSDNVDAVAAVIADSQADLVSLNEVWHDGGPQSALERLAGRLGMAYAFGKVPPPAGDKYETMPPYGNALLSRWPITAYAGHLLPPGSYNVMRGLFEVRLASPAGSPFTVYVTHLDHRSEEFRLQQWAAAEAWIGRDRGRPHLVAGDFNALAASDYADESALVALAALQAERGWPAPKFDLVERVLRSGYVDAYRSAGCGPSATWPASAPERRVDYVFCPQGLAAEVVSCQRWDDDPVTIASDHRPVLAELRL